MPVFHTKIIESILEPVAQQVSQLVILHEQGEAGGAMPDLVAPVKGVGAAVANLVTIGRQTAGGSKDPILKQEMPVAFTRVEEASNLLIQAATMLKRDPHSQEARSKLIDGARGILSGTSTLLLTFDDAEVRKILRQCKAVLEYLVIGEMVESMPDLVTFVKNLTPGITAMAKDVEGRSKELTHKAHAVILVKNLTDVKELTPLLISAMKTFVMTLEKGGTGRSEAQECRNYTIMRMHDAIVEIMRVLQLKIYDEDEAEDPATEMRKAQGIIKGKMEMAKDWLSNPAADAHGLGERAVRDIIQQARAVAVTSNDPRIKQVCTELDQLMDNLAALREKGLGSSPEAMKLSQEVANRLQYLQTLVDDAIAREAGSGLKLPAPTTAGRVEQALNWINDPKSDPKGVGARAVTALATDGRRLAEELSGPERTELLQTCDKVERLAKELADLKARGMGNSPQALAVAKQLTAEIEKLKGLVQKAATRAVVENFMDVTTPVLKLERAANAHPDEPRREENFEEQAGAFEYASQKMVDTAYQVASTGKATSKELKLAIRGKAKEVQDITPQVSYAAKILLMNPNDPTAQSYLTNVKTEYTKMVNQLVGVVDNAVDSADFIRESEEAINRDAQAALIAVKQQNSAVVLVKSGNIARRCYRIIQVANAEAENSDDPIFKDNVMKSAGNLEGRVGPLILYAKSVAQKPGDKKAQDDFSNATKEVQHAVAGVREVFIAAEKVPDVAALSLEDAPPRPPPPRPPLPVEDMIQSQEVDMVLKEPPADNRMAVAAHHLHAEVAKWDEEGNVIIAAAKRMAVLFAKMSRFISDEDANKKLSKKDLIDTAKLIAASSQEVVKRAREVANKCPDRRLKSVLLQTVERIPTIATQLKILATVKATMFGARDEKADLEATEMLVGCAENLMSAVRQTVKETEAASVKIRSEIGGGISWKRQSRW